MASACSRRKIAAAGAVLRRPQPHGPAMPARTWSEGRPQTSLLPPSFFSFFFLPCRGCRRTHSEAAAPPRRKRPVPKRVPKAVDPPKKRASLLPRTAAPLQSSYSPSSSSSSSSSSPDALLSILAQRRVPLIGAALAAGVLGFAIVPLLVTYLKGDCAECATHPHEIAPDAVPSGLPPMGAAAFDASLDLPEKLMGVTRLRKKLAAAAHGAVLEVAVGTGRNLGYYVWEAPDAPDAPDAPGGDPVLASARKKTAEFSESAESADLPFVTSFTGVDLSDDALVVARRRMRSAVPGADALISPKRRIPQQAAAAAVDEVNEAGHAHVPPPPDTAAVVNVLDGRLRLLRGDAMQPLPPAVPSSTYDTIVQTFGLCSVADPVALLANMAAVLRPDSGRILLLEHGRGSWPAVNALLDRYATRHFARYGCWWNRSMDAIVADAIAAVPGLEVVAVHRPGWSQFGTLWWIELRVKSTGCR